MKFLARVALAAGLALSLQWMPACPLYEWAGLSCPGCGTTRALHELAHGHVVAAFALNPLTMSLLPVALYFVLRGKWPAWKPAVWWTLLGVVVTFGVLRNFVGG